MGASALSQRFGRVATDIGEHIRNSHYRPERYYLPPNIAIPSAKPQLEDGSVYRQEKLRHLESNCKDAGPGRAARI